MSDEQSLTRVNHDHDRPDSEETESLPAPRGTQAAPANSERDHAFWAGGEHGKLLIARCQRCGWWLHPPLPVCPACRTMDVRPEAVSGRATVWSATTNRYRWTPEREPPYVLALVELAEQPGLRLLTVVVDCDDVRIGMPVSVRFERSGMSWVPVFGP